ncbi:MAG: hypothetical protein AAGA86_00900, partial [Bacteroidota bacterium]
MNQNTYYIIGGIAIVFAIYIVFLAVYSKNRKKKQLRQFNNLKPLRKEQKHALVFGAILAYHRGEELTELKPKNGIDQYIYGLKNSWEISNKEEAIGVLESLIALRRSSEFDAYLVEPSPDLVKIQKKIAKGLKLDLEAIQQTKSTFAW